MKHLANFLSLLRVVSLPIITILLLRETLPAVITAVILFFLAFLTDTVDGYLARKLGQVSRLGSFLDFFADKLLIYGVIVFFTQREMISFWLLVLFLGRDLFGGSIRWRASRDNIQVQGLSTAVQYTQVFLILGLFLQEVMLQGGYEQLQFPAQVLRWLTGITVSMAFISMVYYLVSYGKGLRQRVSIGIPLRRERMVILGNPKSRGYHDGYRRRLLRRFARRRQAFLHFLAPKKDIFQGTQRLAKRAKQIIIAGGDGTFESALNYHHFWKRALGFFPFGAGNAYYSQFYRGKRFQYLRSRFPFREALLDVLEVEWNGQRRQTTFLSMGLDAEVMRLSGERTQHGLWDYVRAGTAVVFKVKTAYGVAVKISGKKKVHWENCVTLALGKIPYIGYGLRSLVGSARQDDGVIYGSAVVNRHSSRWNKIARSWGLFLAQLGLDKPPLIPFKGKAIEISSEQPFPLQAGGEFLGYTTKIVVKVARQQKVLVI